MLLGHRPVCAVEIDEYCQQVLSARQADGCLPWFPIFADVTTFDGRPWRGLVDVVAGGFPCQDISTAGKGAGIDGEKSGLWREMARVIGEVRPPFAFVENSPVLTSRGLDRVLGDLAEMGYDARWGVVSAADVGAPHERERIWIVAYSTSKPMQLIPGGICSPESKMRTVSDYKRPAGRSEILEHSTSIGRREGRSASEVLCRRAATGESSGCMGHPDMPGPQRHRQLLERARERTPWEDGEVMVGYDGTARIIEPRISPLAAGVARRVERLKSTGNVQVPIVAATAWEILTSCA